jgi:hypothetical protein
MTTIVNFPNREQQAEDRTATAEDTGIGEALDVLNMVGADIREGRVHGILIVTFTKDGGSGLAMGGIFSPSRTLLALEEVKMRTIISEMQNGD